MTNANKPKPAAGQGEFGEQQEPQAPNQGAAAPGEAHSDKESKNAWLTEWEEKLGKERASQLLQLADGISFGGYSSAEITGNTSRATENGDGLQIVRVKVPSKSSGEETDHTSVQSK